MEGQGGLHLPYVCVGFHWRHFSCFCRPCCGLPSSFCGTSHHTFWISHHTFILTFPSASSGPPPASLLSASYCTLTQPSGCLHVTPSLITLSLCTQARLKGVAGGFDQLKDILRRVGRMEKVAEGTFLVLKAEYAAK